MYKCSAPNPSNRKPFKEEIDIIFICSPALLRQGWVLIISEISISDDAQK